MTIHPDILARLQVASTSTDRIAHQLQFGKSLNDILPGFAPPPRVVTLYQPWLVDMLKALTPAVYPGQEQTVSSGRPSANWYFGQERQQGSMTPSTSQAAPQAQGSMAYAQGQVPPQIQPMTVRSVPQKVPAATPMVSSSPGQQVDPEDQLMQQRAQSRGNVGQVEATGRSSGSFGAPSHEVVGQHMHAVSPMGSHPSYSSMIPDAGVQHIGGSPPAQRQAPSMSMSPQRPQGMSFKSEGDWLVDLLKAMSAYQMPPEITPQVQRRMMAPSPVSPEQDWAESALDSGQTFRPRPQDIGAPRGAAAAVPAQSLTGSGVEIHPQQTRQDPAGFQAPKQRGFLPENLMPPRPAEPNPGLPIAAARMDDPSRAIFPGVPGTRSRAVTGSPETWPVPHPEPGPQAPGPLFGTQSSPGVRMGKPALGAIAPDTFGQSNPPSPPWAQPSIGGAGQAQPQTPPRPPQALSLPLFGAKQPGAQGVGGSAHPTDMAMGAGGYPVGVGGGGPQTPQVPGSLKSITALFDMM